MRKSVFVTKSFIVDTLRTSPVKGKRFLESFESRSNEHGLPFYILEDHEVVQNEPEVHKTEGNLWLCFEEKVTFVCSGEFQKRGEHKTTNELKGDSIEGGVEYVLHQGNWLWIPPGEPHLYKTERTARIVINKIPEKNV